MEERTALRIWLLALLVATAARTTPKLVVNKCCSEHEVLDAATKQCVLRKSSFITVPTMMGGIGSYIRLPPFDERWMRSWLPPGIPAGSIEEVWLSVDNMAFNVTQSVTASALWDEKQPTNDSSWRNSIVLEGDFVIRRSAVTGRVLRTTEYCIDATEDPLMPYALVLHSWCSTSEHLIFKCCKEGEALSKKQGGMPGCEQQKTRIENSEKPYSAVQENMSSYCKGDPVRMVEASPKQIENTDFCLNPSQEWSLSDAYLMCADDYIDGNEVKNVLLYCELSRITRAVYKLCRRLPFVTITLLAGAIASIFRTERLRTSAHGWALASHGVCLLGFNAGQILFLLTVRDDIIEDSIHLEYVDACAAFGENI